MIEYPLEYKVRRLSQETINKSIALDGNSMVEIQTDLGYNGVSE